MRVLFIYCNTPLENALPVGVSQISSCLKEKGHTVKLFDTTFYRHAGKSAMENRIHSLQIQPCALNYQDGDMVKDLQDSVDAFNPDMLAFSVVEPTFRLFLKLLESLRSRISSRNIPVIVGGMHAIMAPDTITSATDLVDFICVGEGEIPMTELAEKIENKSPTQNQRGLWVRTPTGWQKNPFAPLVNLETLPPLDFSIYSQTFLERPMMGKLRTSISLDLTRGCPYRCSYCGDFALTELFREQGRWFRQKSTAKIHSELAHQVKAYKPGFVTMMSESFLAGSSRRVSEFSEMYSDFRIPFWFNTRPEDITREKVQLMTEVGAIRMSMGIESGNEAFRKGVLHRNVSNKRILESTGILREMGISFSVNLVIGFPDETREMVFESIKLCREAGADAVSTHIFNPYRGTELRRICEQKNYIPTDLVAEDLFQSYALVGNTLSKDDVLGLFRTIPLYVTLPEADRTQIRLAESFTPEGQAAFEELRAKFLVIKGWSSVAA